VDGSDAKEVEVPNKFSSVYHKGCEKVEKEFDRKLHESFPSVRTIIPN
jgi:hypothetical protein